MTADERQQVLQIVLAHEKTIALNDLTSVRNEVARLKRLFAR